MYMSLCSYFLVPLCSVVVVVPLCSVVVVGGCVGGGGGLFMRSLFSKPSKARAFAAFPHAKNYFLAFALFFGIYALFCSK